MKKSKLPLIYFVLALCAWAVSAYTLWHHVQVNTQGIVEESFCNVSAEVNCDQVALSKYAEFGGIPTAAWALALYSILIVLSVWLIFAHFDQKTHSIKKASAWLLILSIAANIPSLLLASVSILILKNLCMMCAALYVLNICLLVLSLQLIRLNPKDLVRESLFRMPASIYIASLVLVALSFYTPTIFRSALNAGDLNAEMIQRYVQHWKGQPERTFSTENSPYYGNKDAKIIIVEFSDYQCPFCARSAQTLPLVLKDYLNNVKLVVKNYPLNSACNPEVSGAGHPLACIAAKASICVFKTAGNDAALDFKVSLFKQQKSLSQSIIENESYKHGFNKETLDVCLKSEETNQALLSEIAEAKRAGIQGTPAIFMNGRELRGGIYPEVLREVLK